MHRLAIGMVFFALAACKGGKDSDDSNQGNDDGTGTDDSSTPTPGDGCEAPGSSACSNPASIVRGYVARDPDSSMNNYKGNLWVFLTHDWDSQGELGGEYKASVEYEDVDLSDGKPFPFEIDMCGGSSGSMWSEDACGYNLEIVLDLDQSVTPQARLPGDNEPAQKVEDVFISCEGDSLCMDTILLSCKRGVACFSFEPGSVKDCECADTTCNSDHYNCQ